MEGLQTMYLSLGTPMAWCGAGITNGRLWWGRGTMKKLRPGPCSGDLIASGTRVENSL